MYFLGCVHAHITLNPTGKILDFRVVRGKLEALPNSYTSWISNQSPHISLIARLALINGKRNMFQSEVKEGPKYELTKSWSLHALKKQFPSAVTFLILNPSLARLIPRSSIHALPSGCNVKIDQEYQLSLQDIAAHHLSKVGWLEKVSRRCAFCLSRLLMHVVDEAACEKQKVSKNFPFLGKDKRVYEWKEPCLKTHSVTILPCSTSTNSQTQSWQKSCKLQ